jgi:hypothetical protein
VRYENGQLFILPGCRGPGDSGWETGGDDSTTGRLHPFTGQPWNSEMAILSWNELMELVAQATSAGPPRIVEGSVAVRLTASFSEETAKGARISKIRITTKDLIEQLKLAFGVSGRKGSLVRRREIGDLEGEQAQLYLVLDGVEYLVEDFIEPLSISLPEGFQGSASGHTLRRGDGAVSSFELQGVSAIALGDLDLDGFSMKLFSLGGGRFGLTKVRGEEGFLCKRFTSRVTGGMQAVGLAFDSPLLVTGTLQIGPERVVSP